VADKHSSLRFRGARAGTVKQSGHFLRVHSNPWRNHVKVDSAAQIVMVANGHWPMANDRVRYAGQAPFRCQVRVVQREWEYPG
jgi:hypothetical protein